MGSRYFLTAFLPALAFDAPPELSLAEVEFFLKLNLNHHEMGIVHQLYHLFDLENVRSFLMSIPMTAKGAIPHDALREMLENDECPLSALQAFFTLFPTIEERRAHVHELTRFFFKKIPPSLPPFVRRYFWIENISRCLMARIRAKTLGKSFELDSEECGFDPDDPQNWPEIFQPLHTLWSAGARSALDVEEAFSKWKFDTIGSLTADSAPFSLDYVLSYLLQLRLVESRRDIKNPSHQNTLERIAKAVQ